MGRYILCRWPAATGLFPLDPRKPRMGRHRSRRLADPVALCRPCRPEEMELLSRTGGRVFITVKRLNNKAQGRLQGLFVAGPVIGASTATLRRQQRETEDASSNRPSHHRTFRANRTLLSGGTHMPKENNSNQPKRFRVAERSARLPALEGRYSFVLSHRSDRFCAAKLVRAS